MALLFLSAETRANDNGRLMFLIEKMMQYKHKGGFSCSLGLCFHPQETYECCSLDEYVKNEIMCVPKGSDGCSDINVCTTLIGEEYKRFT